MFHLLRSLLPPATLLSLTVACPAAMLSYYVGVDSLATIASGTYAGLPNPNYNRLTFLLSHTYPDTPGNNHYHSKGTQVYTGPSNGAATEVITSPNNFLPEGQNPPLRLAAGGGVYAGKLVTAPYSDSADPGYHFSFLEIGSTLSLSGSAAGSPEAILFHSSSDRWSGAFNAGDIHLELTFLTPGLHIGSATSLSMGLNDAGDDYHLGEGTETFSFTPVLWTDANAAPGVYEARFRLTDESGSFGDSGEFVFRSEVVPEPASGLLGAGTLLALHLRRRRRRD